MNNATNSERPKSDNLISLSEREALLRAQPGFSELGVNDIAKLVGLMEEEHVDAGESIVIEGDIID